MLQFNAIPSLTARLITSLFITGKVPGCANETGLTCVFGSAPKAMESPLNNLLLVSSWACTSNPITIWYFSFIFTFAKIGMGGQSWEFVTESQYWCLGKTKGSYKYIDLRGTKRKSIDQIADAFSFSIHDYKFAVFNFFGILISNFMSVLFLFASIE